MIIYKNTSAEFLRDVNDNVIVESIKRSFVQQLGWFPVQEANSWNNSLRFMESVVRNSGLQDDCGVLIEYGINSTRKRIDFAISGVDDQQAKNIVIIELKQWESAKETLKDSLVISRINRNEIEVAHPSYQAYSYKNLLVDFYEIFEKGTITPYSCAYLHNYRKKNPEPLHATIYEWIVADSPIFFQHDTQTIQTYIRERVGHGKGMEILSEIENSKRKPTKKLADHVCSMFKGNKVFTLIDNQKVAFENAVSLALHSTKKTVLIIKGGPGTGKSVISVNLLGELLRKGQNAVFVAPNAAFRDVMIAVLAGENRRNRLANLFKGSSSFLNETLNSYDTIVVDEAHRLKNETAYQYKGKNQVDDVIKAGLVTIFLIDESQRVRPEDIGSISEIRRIAKLYKADVHEMELDAQFRCAGAEGFINWLDDLLQIKETGNFDGWDRKNFEFKVFNDPRELRKAIKAKQKDGLSARMLAGYAWKWTSESEGNRNGEVEDVTIPDFNFRMPWNSRQSRTTWAIDESGVDQIGCIHTSQGLEFDYVGVIIGPDLEFDMLNNSYGVPWTKYKDAMGKRRLKNNPEQLCRLVKNIYRTLMSRGQKGCYVYVCNSALAEHLEARLKAIDVRYVVPVKEIQPSLRDRIETFVEEHLMFTSHLPVYSMRGACGKFGNGEAVEPAGWLKAGDSIKPNRNMFIVRAVGASMEPQIADGSYCIFRTPVIGTRQGKIVLVQHHGVEDPDYGGSYTIKKYSSRKSFAADDIWKHEEIVLQSLNGDFEDIVLSDSGQDDYVVLGEYIGSVPLEKANC